MRITKNMANDFRLHLIKEERSNATVEKYIRDITAFLLYAGESGCAEIDKDVVIEYKHRIQERYKPKSVNSMLSSLNSFFSYLGEEGLRVKTLKIQREAFASKEREITRAEYERLLSAAGKGSRLYFIIMTLCAAGIRVSELRYITVEAISRTYAEVKGKGKTRKIMLPKDLCRELRHYARKIGIRRGSIFVTKTGNPVDRTNIWSSMKKLCKAARVKPDKVFPHNLRHLFAVTFYSMTKDIVKLSDILGHSSIDTTRIYTMESGVNHRKALDKMRLVITDTPTAPPVRRR